MKLISIFNFVFHCYFLVYLDIDFRHRFRSSLIGILPIFYAHFDDILFDPSVQELYISENII